MTNTPPGDDGRYAGPPPTAQPAQYGGPYPAPYPGTPYAVASQGDPYAPNPYGYAPSPYSAYPRPNDRPGTVIGAAVLGYVNAGLLIIAAALLFVGASTIEDLESQYGPSSGVDTELAFAGIINLIAAGLLIAGAVAMSGRRPAGRPMFLTGSALVIVSAVYWLARWGSREYFHYLFFYIVVFATIAIVGLALSLTSSVNTWLAAGSDAPPRR